MNFDEIIDRVGTHSSKWDMMQTLYGVSPDDGISMWVADMDFRPPQSVQDALQGRLNHGVYGYFADNSEYEAALQNWLKTRHNAEVETSWMQHVHGLVQGVAMVLQALTKEGDGVITFNPVYHAFGRTIRANGRDPIEVPLVNENGRYEMDLEALQASLKGHEKLIIFCSPHNPGGRVWSREEIQALADFAVRNDLYILSDEIHMDLVYGDEKHHVFGTVATEVSDRLVYLMSATKTFNIAGALTGTILTPNAELRAKIAACCAAAGIIQNLFGMIACTAAYQGGAEWLDGLNAYLKENERVFGEMLSEIPGVKPMRMGATYLQWVDFRDLGLNMKELEARVAKDAGIAANAGPTFGAGGKGFMRFNLATPRARVLQAAERMQKAFADVQ